jgi:hypothetical protein
MQLPGWLRASSPGTAPERRPRPGHLSPGLALVLLLLALLALVAWRDRPPAIRPASCPPGEFSEDRARPVIHHLAAVIGERRMGSRAARAAADHLEATLRRSPRLEIAVHEATVNSTDVWAGVPFVARVRNVMARLPGDSPEAILVSAHYDTKPLTPGAADNALGVAAALEVARVLGAGRRLPRTVIFNFNSGEEVGLFGAMAFADHPWRKDVRAFVNLDAAGSGGKAILFRATHAKRGLLQAYRQVPYPYATSVGEDLFRLGVVPSDTDFRVYRDRVRLPGLDFALFQDGYAYHTPLDRPERIASGSLQQMGENTLAVVRALAARSDLAALAVAEAPGAGEERWVYHDILGLFFLAYPGWLAGLLAAAGGLLSLLACGLVIWRRAATVGAGAAGLVVATLAAVLAILVSLGAALGVAGWLGRPHGWFALPGPAICGFAAAAGAGLLAVHGLWAWRSRHAAEARFFGVWMGALVLWTVLLSVSSAAGLGSSYLFLWWTLPGAIGLAVAASIPSRRIEALLVSSLPGALITLEAVYRLVALSVPLAGRMPLPLPFDPVLAVLVASPLALFGSAAAACFHLRGGLRRPALGAAVVALVALGATAWRFPYTGERPKRIAMVRTETPAGGARLVWKSHDFLPIGRALAGTVPGLAAAPQEGAGALAVAVAPLPESVEFARVGVSPLGFDPVRQLREVAVAVAVPGDGLVTLEIPRTALVGWSHSRPLPPLPAEAGFFTLRLHTPGEVAELRLTLNGSAPVPIGVTETRFLADPSPVASRPLPPWMTPASAERRRRRTISL